MSWQTENRWNSPFLMLLRCGGFQFTENETISILTSPHWWVRVFLARMSAKASKFLNLYEVKLLLNIIVYILSFFLSHFTWRSGQFAAKVLPFWLTEVSVQRLLTTRAWHKNGTHYRFSLKSQTLFSGAFRLFRH